MDGTDKCIGNMAFGLFVSGSVIDINPVRPAVGFSVKLMHSGVTESEELVDR